MLDFLEKGIKSKRPAYDGVVMVCHVQERIPVLLKALKRLNLMDRFKVKHLFLPNCCCPLYHIFRLFWTCSIDKGPSQDRN